MKKKSSSARMEMKIIEFMFSCLSGLSIKRLRSKQLTSREFDKIFQAYDILNKAYELNGIEKFKS